MVVFKEKYLNVPSRGRPHESDRWAKYSHSKSWET